MHEKGLKIWYFPKFHQKWTPHILFALFWYPTPQIWNFHFICRGFPLNSILDVQKVRWKGVKINLFEKNSHRGIRKFFSLRSQIFRYGLPEEFFSRGQKDNGFSLCYCLPPLLVNRAAFCSWKYVQKAFKSTVIKTSNKNKINCCDRA